MFVVNLFAYRATSPVDLKNAKEPVGLMCDMYLETIAQNAAIVMCGWGNHGNHMGRDMMICHKLEALGITPRCLGVNKTSGQPKHPLYIKSGTPAIHYQHPNIKTPNNGVLNDE